MIGTRTMSATTLATVGLHKWAVVLALLAVFGSCCCDALWTAGGDTRSGKVLQQVGLQEQICGASGYDVNNLTMADYWTFDQSDGQQCLGNASSCSFMMSFCKPLVVSKFTTSNCSNASVCEKTDSGSEFKLSSYTANPFRTNNTFNGFVALFNNGSTYHTNTGAACNISVLINLECNGSAFWSPVVKSGLVTPSPVPVPVDVFFFPSNCLYIFRMDYEGACHKIGPAVPVDQVSAGTVIIIIFAITCTVYFLGGMLVNCIRGEKGVDLLPNSEFWKMVPTWIKDGFQYCCGGVNHQSSTSYESI